MRTHVSPYCPGPALATIRALPMLERAKQSQTCHPRVRALPLLKHRAMCRNQDDYEHGQEDDDLDRTRRRDEDEDGERLDETEKSKPKHNDYELRRGRINDDDGDCIVMRCRRCLFRSCISNSIHH